MATVDFPDGVPDTSPTFLVGGNAFTQEPAKAAVGPAGRTLLAANTQAAALAALGTIPSADVAYANTGYPSVATVRDALDAILYVPLSASLGNNVGTVEVGRTITDVTLSWAYNKASVVSQSISPGYPTLNPTVRTAVLTGQSITSDRTWALTASDGTQSAGASTGIAFQHRRRWGFSAQATPDQALIAGLANQEFATSRQQSRSLSPSNQYIYFAWPTSFGTPTFVVNGLLNTGYVRTQVSFTNASGNTTQFDVWRSGYILTGSGIQVVVQ